MNCQTDTQPKTNYLTIGTLVKTSKISDPKAFGSRDAIKNRREDNGSFYGYVPGTSGEYLWVKHFDSNVAVYSIDEVKTAGEAPVVTKAEIVEFANEVKTRLYDRFQGKQLYMWDITQAVRDMLVHKLTKEGWKKISSK